MFTKTVLAAAAFAAMIAVAPVTAAQADPDINFGFTIETPNGSISFGNGGFGFDAPDTSMSCSEAKQYLKTEFTKVDKIECNGDVYTFKVKKFFGSPWKTLKLNSDNGAWWFV